MLSIINSLQYSNDPLKNKNITKLFNVIIICFIIIFILGYISYFIHTIRYPKSTIFEWLNTKNISIKIIIVGMISGIVFGFIENIGLWLGMDVLEPFISGVIICAGWGILCHGFGS